MTNGSRAWLGRFTLKVQQLSRCNKFCCQWRSIMPTFAFAKQLCLADQDLLAASGVVCILVLPLIMLQYMPFHVL